MPYPKNVKKENTNWEDAPSAPAAPKLPPVTAPRVQRPSGGAPKLNPLAPAQPKSMRPLWQRSTMPTPPAMTLAQTQEQLRSLTTEMKNRFDTALQQNPAIVARNPRFWKAYQDYPDGVAAMLARRVHTDQIVGRGPVSDFMNFLEGRK